jgi:hypothetical protein
MALSTKMTIKGIMLAFFLVLIGFLIFIVFFTGMKDDWPGTPERCLSSAQTCSGDMRYVKYEDRNYRECIPSCWEHCNGEAWGKTGNDVLTGNQINCETPDTGCWYCWHADIEKINSLIATIEAKKEACENANGTVSWKMFCKSVGNFPDTCLIGASGCSADNSHVIEYCQCETGKCWDSSQNKCVES